MKRKTLSDLKRAAKKYNAIVSDDSAGRWGVYQVEAPYGKLWADGAPKNLKIEWNLSFPEDRSEAIEDGINRINCGLIDMTAQDRIECDEM